MSAVMPGQSGSKADPNLTPLLDLVLQLIMFFMLCANFVMEQVNESIRLPEAIAAKSLDQTKDAYIILNVTEQGKVLLAPGEPVLEGPVQVLAYMRNRIDLDRARTKPRDWEEGKGRSVIILRGHRNCTAKQIHDVITACQRAGYTDIQLRTLLVSG